MKLTRLNPYQLINDEIDAWITANYDTIKTLALRNSPTGANTREINLSKPILANTALIGMVNVNVINEKYDTRNLKTDTLNIRNLADKSPGELVNAESFKEKFIDAADYLVLRFTIKQFASDAMGKASVTMSMVYRFNVARTDALDVGIASKKATSNLWEDPAMVLATRYFFTGFAKPVMDTWVPTPADVTGLVVYSQTE